MSDITKFLPPKRNRSLTTVDSITESFTGVDNSFDSTIQSKTITVANAAQVMVMFYCQWKIDREANSNGGPYNDGAGFDFSTLKIDYGNGTFVDVMPLKIKLTANVDYGASQSSSAYCFDSHQISAGTTVLRAKAHIDALEPFQGEIMTRFGCYVVS